MVSVDCVCQKGVCAQTLTVFIIKDALSVKLVPSLKKILQQTDGQKTNPVYSLGHGHEKIIHTRLGLGLSSLNELVLYVIKFVSDLWQVSRLVYI
jgi:hypothetical protein